MTTAEAAVELGLSIGSVQKLVATGDLQAIRTQGGHRRIFVNSIDQYRKVRGYSMPSVGDTICIMHQGDDLDPLLAQENHTGGIQLMFHPLDLLGIKKDIDALFIDARNLWLQSTPMALMEELKKRYNVFIYNCAKFPDGGKFVNAQGVSLIAKNIDNHYISGYRAGRLTQRKPKINYELMAAL